MASATATNGAFTLKAYQGDNKTLLAFNFVDAVYTKNLAGFTIECQPPGQVPYYLLNDLRFENPSQHAQVHTEKPNSTLNAPIQKFRWVHVTGMTHQGLKPAVGEYIYTVTPRYFDARHSMLPLDSSLSASATIHVGPFRKGSLSLGFTRGYMQSEAFAHHFGAQTRIVPPDKPLRFDTSSPAGTNNEQTFTYSQIYEWAGSTARQRIFAILHSVLSDKSLRLDVFAYDLDEPDIVRIFLQLASEGRIRIILDNAPLHLTHKDPKTGQTVRSSEDQFTALFKKQAKEPADILRGSFGRFSHDKVFILSKNGAPTQVLTGSTNFSITGLYVNANHVLVFTDVNVASQYKRVFDQSWAILTKFPKTPSKRAAGAFSTTAVATNPFVYQTSSMPKLSITFSPHTLGDVSKILGGTAARIAHEDSSPNGSVLFAVMQLTGSETPVYAALNLINSDTSVFSYGVSDSPKGTHFYERGSKTGVLVTGKPGKTTLPPPFDQVSTPPGHEIHDKFVICGLNGADPVVYCGSSNLATGGEACNGDNLIEIHDAEVATAFAIETLLLVDHYNFLDRYAGVRNRCSPKAATLAVTSRVQLRGARLSSTPRKTAAKRKH